MCSNLNSILNNDLLILINKKKILYFIFICSLFFIFLAVFYNQLGITQIGLILKNLLCCILLYWLFTMISHWISRHMEAKSLYGTGEKSKEHLIEYSNKRAKPKNIWKYKNIIIIKLCLGGLFFFFLLIPLTYIFTVIHEFAHAITGLVSGVQIEKIRILGPREGYTEHSLLSSNVIMSLFSIAGSMGEILFGIVLLALIFRNKSTKLDILIPIYCVIGFNFTYILLYWHSSVIIGKGDAASILFYNPQINPQFLLIICGYIFSGLAFYLLFNLRCTIIHRKVLFIKYYYPDFMDKKLYQLMKNLFLKKT